MSESFVDETRDEEDDLMGGRMETIHHAAPLPKASVLELVQLCHGRMTGRDRGVGHCPLPENHHHHDRTCSLSISKGHRGVVMNCHACHGTFADLCAALHVHPSQLFDDDLPVRGNGQPRPRPQPRPLTHGEAMTRLWKMLRPAWFALDQHANALAATGDRERLAAAVHTFARVDAALDNVFRALYPPAPVRDVTLRR